MYSEMVNHTCVAYMYVHRFGKHNDRMEFKKKCNAIYIKLPECEVKKVHCIIQLQWILVCVNIYN